MRKSIKIFMTSAVMLLLGSGVAGAAQTQLQGSLIPQFVEPLPFLAEFEILNAMSAANSGLDSTPFPVNAEEFQSQILPTQANWLVASPATYPATCRINDPDPLGGPNQPGASAGTASWTYGYLSGIANVPGLIRPTYLGPIVIAQRGVAAKPTYGNHIPDPDAPAPAGRMGVVQYNMPIDMTLDWAMAAYNNTGPGDAAAMTGCEAILDPTSANYLEFQNPLCNVSYPFYDGSMPIAAHLHGGEIPPAFDGGPDAWFTPDSDSDGSPDVIGAGWPGYEYTYPNNQQESMIWFHDHALGITRLNVFAGLAGIQPIIDPDNATDSFVGGTTLPQLGGDYFVPLILQDRTFDTNCEIYYNLASNPMPNPLVHPFWIPEFIGDTIVVNGKTWPYFNVEPRQYRFSFVNGSNSRFYELELRSADDPTATQAPYDPVLGYVGAKMPMLVIATDDGYLMNAAPTDVLVIGPGERYEVIVDFKVDGMGLPLPANNMPMLYNKARTPYPGGGTVVNQTTGKVMQFRLPDTTDMTLPLPGDTTVVAGSPLRDPLMNPIYPIKNAWDPVNGIKRQLTLNEAASPLGPLELVVNNSKFNKTGLDPSCTTSACRETEIPAVGDTEIWEIINISADAHPMHTHLTSFQVIDRQAIQAGRYIAKYDSDRFTNGVGDGEGPPWQYNNLNADGAIGGNPAVGPFLKGKKKLPNAYEMGWKDTVITYPGEVTRIAIRWAPTDLPVVGTDPNTGKTAPTPGTNSYVGFDPTVLVADKNDDTGATKNVGYVWHCHIVDHEDNEMMRNYTVSAGTPGNPTGRQMVVPNGGF